MSIHPSTKFSREIVDLHHWFTWSTHRIPFFWRDCLQISIGFLLNILTTRFHILDLRVVIRMKFLPLDDSVNYGARHVQFPRIFAYGWRRVLVDVVQENIFIPMRLSVSSCRQPMFPNTLRNQVTSLHQPPMQVDEVSRIWVIFSIGLPLSIHWSCFCSITQTLHVNTVIRKFKEDIVKERQRNRKEHEREQQIKLK